MLGEHSGVSPLDFALIIALIPRDKINSERQSSGDNASAYIQ